MPGTRRPLTERQAEVLRAIKEYIKHNGISPTFCELSDIFSVHIYSIYRTVQCIKERGWIAMERAKARTIRVIPDEKEIGLPIQGAIDSATGDVFWN